jgi:hypothetical protein
MDAQFKLTHAPDESFEVACNVAVDLCAAAFALPFSTATRCLVYDVAASDSSCSFSAHCDAEEVSLGSRSVAASRAHAVHCDSHETGWDCACDGELSPAPIRDATFYANRSDLPGEASPCVDYFVQECDGVLDTE